MSKTLLLTLLIQALLYMRLDAVSFTNGRLISDVPNPNKDPLACGRMNVAKSAVCDPDNKLTKDAKDEIEGYINQITTAQVAVAVIDKMKTDSNDIDAASEKFARTIHDNWGVGSADKNDGILVFLSIKDRSVYISTGSGVQSKVTSRYIQDIINDMKPHLRQSNYGGALSTCIIELDMYLSGNAGQIKSKVKQHLPTSSSSGTSGNSLIIYIVIILGFTGVGIFNDWRRNRRIKSYERGRTALENLMKDVDNTEENNKYFTSSCPICLEDFPVSPRPAIVPKEVTTDNDNGMENVDLGHDKHSGQSNVAGSTVPGQFGAKRPKALRCGHTFCAECLESFLKTSDGSKCPICRMPVEDDGSDGRPSNVPRNSFAYFGGSSNSSSSNPQSGSNGNSGINGSTEPRRSCADSFRTDDLPTDTNYHDTGSSTSGPQQRFTSGSTSSSSFFSNSFSRRTPELLFRMNRMRYLYPDVMTVELLRNMNSAVDRGNIHEFRSHVTSRGSEVTRIVADIRAQAAAAAKSSGSRGSSMSFGGGRSSGGGGGRW